MSNIKQEYLKQELEHIEHHNKMAPFPAFDAEYVKMVKSELSKTKEDYDKQPVYSCGNCGSLHIQVDDMELNNVCMRCGTSNDIVKFDDVHKWKDSNKGKYWNK